MAKYEISINQLASFAIATEAQKRRIILNQKNPNKFILPWYQMPKARIAKSLKNNGDVQPILDGMAELKARILNNPRQINDRQVSMEAMQRYLQFQLPRFFAEQDYEVLKPKTRKSVLLNEVELIVAPEVIFKFSLNGIDYFGGAKVHIAKAGKFVARQQRLVATAIHLYLQTEIAGETGVVLPQLCLSIDVFGEGFISAPEDPDLYVHDLELICEEVKRLWFAA